MRLFHVSEDPKIEIFHPRPPPSPNAGVSEDVVWAVDEEHLPNYLLPRDCPRVTFAGTNGRVVAVEEKWRAKIESCTLFLYEFSPKAFDVADKGAGYYVSKVSVVPASVSKVTSLFGELERRKIEIRILPNLWDLRDQVVKSSVEFSVIRFRNAQPRGSK